MTSNFPGRWATQEYYQIGLMHSKGRGLTFAFNPYGLVGFLAAGEWTLDEVIEHLVRYDHARESEITLVRVHYVGNN